MRVFSLVRRIRQQRVVVAAQFVEGLVARLHCGRGLRTLLALHEHELPGKVLTDRFDVAFEPLGFDVDLFQPRRVDGVGLVAGIQRRKIGTQCRVRRSESDEERFIARRYVAAHGGLLVEQMNEHVTGERADSGQSGRFVRTRAHDRRAIDHDGRHDRQEKHSHQKAGADLYCDSLAGEQVHGFATPHDTCVAMSS